MEAMGSHTIEPLDSLSLELPNGEIVVGYDKDIAALQEEISALRSRQQHLDHRRREALDKLIDLKGSIRVFCRVRPLISTINQGLTTNCRKELMVNSVSYPRLFKNCSLMLQKTVHLHTLSISMLEVYLGNLRDLLVPRQPLFRHNDCTTGSNISILATKSGAVEVEGLTDVSMPDLKKANQLYFRGRRARSTSWTNVNDVSSRSHCLTRIRIRRCGVTEEVSKLWLINLGGSERLLKTGASGLTMDEGKAINLSLSALGDVIAALRRKRSHVPYRNSKLTQILSDSLGDRSKVLMVVHISPSEDDVSETVCSLNFAERARSIKSNRDISEDQKMLKLHRLAELDKEICDTEHELKYVNEQIRRAEMSLEEKKKLSSSVCQSLSDEKGSPRSTLVTGHIDTTESPQAITKPKNRVFNGSVPHFMSSTQCSRQRHNAVSHSISKPRLTKSVIRYPAELSGNQSFSYSSCKNAAKARSVAFSSNVPKSKYLPVKSDQINICSNSIDSTAASVPKQRESFSSRPVQRAPLYQHSRRMSSLT